MLNVLPSMFVLGLAALAALLLVLSRRSPPENVAERLAAARALALAVGVQGVHFAEEAATVGVWPECVGVDDNLTDHLDNGVPLTFTAGRIAQCSSRGSVGGVALRNRNVDWTFKGDFFRIQSASLTYRLPESWLPFGFTAARVQFRATNIHLFTGFPTGTDPDALLGAANNELFRSGGYTLPAPRTYSLNLRVNF